MALWLSAQAAKAATAQQAVDEATANRRLLESERDSLKVCSQRGMVRCMPWYPEPAGRSSTFVGSYWFSRESKPAAGAPAWWLQLGLTDRFWPNPVASCLTI